MYQLNYGEAH
jgi:hypothetical protein